ncbi:radical SAM protein [Candidatus Uhrbacteria bacterium]|nr:radical SAM protein [Candidatus Uhrbacteria bacterium]
MTIVPLGSPDLARILSQCAGDRSLEEIAYSASVSKEALMSFLSELQNVGVVDFNDTPVEHRVLSRLGPSGPWLREVHIDVTDKCNLATFCRHCFRGSMLNQGADHPTEEWLSVIRDIAHMGAATVALSGGELFMRRDIPVILKEIFENGLFCSAIFTNGTLRTREMEQTLDFIIRHGLHTSFYISLDGFDDASHDANRGEGSYRRTRDFVEYLVARKRETGAVFSVVVNSQINTHNFHSLITWYDEMKKMGIDKWRLTSGRIVGRLAENNHLVPPVESLFREYVQLIQSHVADVSASATDMTLNIESFFRTNMLVEKRALTFREDTVICDYKQNACSIEPNGNVQFCTSWGSRVFGNVFTEGIREVWRGEELQQLKSMRIEEIAECRGCTLLEFCGGGCRLTAETVKSRDAIACERYQLFVQDILPLLQRENIAFVSNP